MCAFICIVRRRSDLCFHIIVLIQRTLAHTTPTWGRHPHLDRSPGSGFRALLHLQERAQPFLGDLYGLACRRVGHAQQRRGEVEGVGDVGGASEDGEKCKVHGAAQDGHNLIPAEREQQQVKVQRHLRGAAEGAALGLEVDGVGRAPEAGGEVGGLGGREESHFGGGGGVLAVNGRRIVVVGRVGGGRGTDPRRDVWWRGGGKEVKMGEKGDQRQGRRARSSVQALDIVRGTPHARDALGVVAEFILKADRISLA